jgi:hypothetical protein
MAQSDDMTKTVYDEHGHPITVNAGQFEQAVARSDNTPPSGSEPQPPQVVYVARPHEPAQPVISDAVMQKHEASKREYPYLNLSDGEYIISAIRRHPIGLLAIGVLVGSLWYFS